MATPLVVLGFLAVVAGGLPGFGSGWFNRFVAEPHVVVTADAHAAEVAHDVATVDVEHDASAMEVAQADHEVGVEPGMAVDEHAIAPEQGMVADENAADPHGVESLVGDTSMPDAQEIAGGHGAETHALEEATPADTHEVADAHLAEAGHEAEGAHGEGHHDVHHVAHQRAMVMSLFAAGLGILLSWLFYIRRAFRSEAVQAALPGVHRTLDNKYWFDEFYRDHVVANVLRLAKLSAGLDRIVVDGIVNGAGYFTRFAGDVSGHIDRLFVDGLVNAVGDVLRGIGSMVSSWQTGRVQNYFLGLVGGLVVLILVYRTVWLG